MENSSFVDLQVNGYLGIDFSDIRLTFEDIIRTADELGKRGTGAFLATVITSETKTYRHVLPLLAKALKNPEAQGRILGIHLEGPFISPEDGAVGAHPKNAVASPSISYFDELYELAKGKIKLMTVAPECSGADRLIQHAAGKGVAVSVGHSLAADQDIARAVDAGATLSTHLGNGIPNLINRHHNPIYAQLSSSLAPMLITDGHHIPPALLKIILGLKGVNSTIITSDSAPVAGMPPGEYEIFGTRVRICEDGACRNLNAPTLAGSSSAMIDCMNHIKNIFPALTEQELWKMGRDNPLAAIGMQHHLPKLPKNVCFRNERFVVDGKTENHT